MFATSVSDSTTLISHLYLSKIFIDINNDSSISHARQAYQLALKLKSKSYQAQSLDLMGAVLLRRGNLDQSLDYLLQSNSILSSLNDIHFLKINNRNIAGVYKSLNDYDRARGYYLSGLNIPLSGDSTARSWLLMDIGDLYLQMGKLDSALYYTKKSIDIISLLSDRVGNKYLPVALLTLGKILEKKGNVYEAQQKYRQAVEVGLKFHNLQAAAENYIAIAHLFKKSGKTDSSFIYAKKAFDIAIKVNNPKSIAVASSFLKDYYRSKNNFDSAFLYQEIGSAAKDSLLSLEKIRQIQNLSFKERLQQQAIQDAKNELRNRVKVYSLVAGLVILIGAALFLYRNNRQKQKANALLKFQKERTERAYEQLKATQVQLIQSEKMASLGELTAGIAHEIQNPLNFINNFSDFNTELIEELEQEADKGNLVELKSIANDIKENERKINHHGKRADAIVKGMLQHSRANTGKKEPTDINALADEYLRLSYHGLRAKDRDFNADFTTNFDAQVGKIDVVPQDIGRVLLNVYNNAFFAVFEKMKRSDKTFKPLVSVTTKRVADKVEITIKDNGIGIPQKVVDKIFQPFFTTKPTGQGTGLGLSLSYDIVKTHSGEITVESTEGDGTTFIITIPTT
ncbi:hypothetical protein SAE01_03910 [Segetibacter aerophilus]|uniref:histidine kinase n=2 Tax=Segetibacter aerophilus TaxID=670293 RepID=A0A512B7G0_9BACT|nr:hypothetical protein SAE01_03910 [Segetibacter aerophilus]